MPIELDKLLSKTVMIDTLKRDVLHFKASSTPSRNTKKSALIALQNKLKRLFLDNLASTTRSPGLPPSAVYPALFMTISRIMDLEYIDDLDLKNKINALTSELEALPDDWSTEQSNSTFHDLNTYFGYFSGHADLEKLQDLFKELAITCRMVMTVLEGYDTIIDDEVYRCAYHIMALFVNNPADIKLDSVYASMNKIIKASESKVKPLQDLFLNIDLPVAHLLHDLPGWRQFISHSGKQALAFFNQATQIEELLVNQAPKTIPNAKAAAALVSYLRGHEDRELAALCYTYESKRSDADERSMEEVFNRCLDYIQTDAAWPKKITDNLPDITVNVENKYYWVKLPPSDKRGLILGKITDCCQSIGGNADDCVKEAVSLPNNGLYVLLKKIKATDNLTNILNDPSFQIIGQSYVWKSTSGDLCLDSIECLSHSISNEQLQQLVLKFAHAALEHDPSMRQINVGRGGKTPQGLFPTTVHALTMQQGQMYGDAGEQYVIAESVELIFSKDPIIFADWKIYQASIAQPQSIVAFLKTLTEEQRQQTLMLTDSNNRTLLMAASCGIIACDVRDILSLYSDHQAQMTALQWKDCHHQTALHLATSHPAALQVLLDLYPENARYAKLKDVWLYAISSADSIRVILKSLPVVDRIKFLSETTYFAGPRNFHVALSNPRALEVILKFFSEEERFELVKIGSGSSSLQKAVDYPESFKILLMIYPANDRLNIVKKKGLVSESVLGLLYDRPQSVKNLLELLPKSDRLAAVKDQNIIGYSLLDYACVDLEMLQIILELLPENDRMEVILHYSKSLDYYKVKPELLQMIFEMLPKNERLNALKEKNQAGESVFDFTIYKPDLFKVILKLLPANDRMSAVLEKIQEGDTVMDFATLNHELLGVILEHLPVDDRLEALKKIDKHGQYIFLHRVVVNPESLKMILKFLPAKDLLDILKFKDLNGKTVLNEAAKNPRSLDLILKALSSENLTALIHDEASLMKEGYEKKTPQSEHSQKLVDIICVELNKRKAAMIRATLQENKQRLLCDQDKKISSSNPSSKRTAP